MGMKPKLPPMLVATGAGVLGLILEGWVTASAAPPPCSTTENPRSAAYQFRSQMDRCEGIRGSRPIAALGLRLASYTVGQAQIERHAQQGEVFRLLVPAELGSPVVTAQALGGEYQMTPLRLGTPRQGWRPFEWGAGLIQRERISATQLRATAMLSQAGEADQWLPVKFSPAGAYSLVISSNGALPVANVRILGPGSRLVKECSGPTRLESELFCRWDARNLPPGTYQLVARSAEGGGALLNVSLRHNPSWLTR
jgi:hypothetical protein